MIKSWTFFCLVLFLIAEISVRDATGQQNPADRPASNEKLPSMHIEQYGAYNALSEISKKAHLTLGVDAIRPAQEPTVEFDFPGGTVADLLNMFVSKVPDYSWQEDDRQIVHVSRKDGHVALLDVVMNYPGAVKRSRKQIWEDIAKRPEVSAWLDSNRCARSELFGGWEFREHNDPISIEPGFITVSQLLDEVAVKSGENYWAVLQSGSANNCRIDIILW